MTHQFADHMFTQGVKQTQHEFGSRPQNERLQSAFGPNDRLTEREAQFIGQRDSFYLATVNENGWPYVQHRGGPIGFANVLDSTHIAYADFRGNTQLISAGNVTRNDRCSLIFIDYANRRRLKILGRLTMQDVRDAPKSEIEGLLPSDYVANVERLAIIQVVAFDWNCPQHITPRYTVREYSEVLMDSE
ncbi:MAG: pyridoxamine 5'-phosphate oxidase family protein [Pseudomonadaceae bacterium]|nr:pyridoxamine 5'-phosphate oxidase family protein [Pseudomonadaceae bacterium]